MNKEPETYEELIRQKRVYELVKYYYLTQEELEQIYDYLVANPDAVIEGNKDYITLAPTVGSIATAAIAASVINAKTIDGMKLTNGFLQIFYHYESSGGGGGGSSSNNNNKKSSSSRDDGQYTSWDYFSHTYAYAGAGQVAIKAKASCRELLNVYVPKIYTDDKGNEYQVATDYDEGFENLSSTSITLPDGFEKINIGFDNSFYLKKIYLPASIIKIEGEIITNCLSLETIDFKGTKAQWEAINKDERWNYQAPAFDISCSDGIINVPKWSEPAS